MKFLKILVVILIFGVTIGFNTHLFSTALFDLFSDVRFNKEGLKRVEKFNPDEDILYLPPMKGKKLFEAINDLSICRKKDVRKFLYLYLTNNREYVRISIQRSYKYMDDIMNIFKDEDIPEELSLLPLLESGFVPRAVSRSNAVGLWQFMQNTSKPLGLKKNAWVDERRNIKKSTRAAIRHLKLQHKNFKSWGLALAAYNGGGGYIARLMKKTGAKDIWELRETGKLKKETYDYVPKFIALLLIYKNQKLFGIKKEIQLPEKINIDTFVLKHPMNIKKISNISGISLKTIKELNPELNHYITPLNKKKYSLLVPAKDKQKLIKIKKKLYKYKLQKTHRS